MGFINKVFKDVDGQGHQVGQSLEAAVRPVTLITGASSGIGASMAKVFARHGDEVVLTARREDRLKAIADTIAAAGHKRPQTLAVDLGCQDGIETLARELAARQLEPAVVVNNAGFGLLGPAATLDRHEQLAMVDLNVRSLTDLSLRWIDSLVRHRGGILNVASIASFIPGPGMTVYHATKAYVLSFSEGLRRELKPKGVRVTVLCPGPVNTGFQERARVDTKHYPRGFLRSADDVAEQGFKGFKRGQLVVVPGLHNKIVPWLPRFMPREALATQVYHRLRHWEDA